MENNTSIKLKNNTKNISISSKILRELILELSSLELRIVLKLFTILNNDSIICVNNRPISMKEISLAIDESYDVIRKVVPSLKNKEILLKKQVSISNYNIYGEIYILNPWICNKNNHCYFEILELFKNSKWKLLIDNNLYSRHSYEYIVWEKSVMERDENKCIICGSSLDIEVHHISPFSIDYENRTNIDNGVCLCKRHHSSKVRGSFHNIYGTINNTPEQLLEYIRNKRTELNIIDKAFIKSPFILEHISKFT